MIPNLAASVDAPIVRRLPWERLARAATEQQR